ncbi:TetR/AcrR family transcriptional regulator [Saccharopolyspora sp. K220]|uniref:TetR/AcrR family transcriptional regulator n=1 Tax=Saccharopolyspora soli TaxID=2926618 RepID=UPI001F5A635A|nr:TetR/AcrR family transcriptional regulator [Saccharopolyspora soli]MCI2417913.1 TetR/AcrR family transcriptional regulator [Saccharopolyspora soli]
MARPREFSEAAVVRAARDQFWDTGFAGTSIIDLTKATGLGKGSLYGAFGDKHQLYLRAFDDYCTEAVSHVEKELFEGPGKAIDRLRAHVVGTTKSVIADKAHRGCLLAKSTAELTSHDPAVAERALKTFVELENLLTACVQEAQRDRDIDPDADARELGGLLLATLRGIEALGKAGVGRRSLLRTAEAALRALPPGHRAR